LKFVWKGVFSLKPVCGVGGSILRCYERERTGGAKVRRIVKLLRKEAKLSV
jgi:hypothetical protein